MNKKVKVSIGLLILQMLIIGVYLLGCEDTYYRYTLEIMYCDNRPNKIMSYTSLTYPRIRNEDSESHNRAVTELDLGFVEYGYKTQYNVCEFTILERKLDHVKKHW